VFGCEGFRGGGSTEVVYQEAVGDLEGWFENWEKKKGVN